MRRLAALFALICVCRVGFAGDVEKAATLYSHGLVDDATREFIDVLYDEKPTEADQAESLYWLGQIAFDGSRFSVAFDDWGRLVAEFPESTQAQGISGRMAELRDVLAAGSTASVASAIARSHLRNAEFWSEAPTTVTIDSSGMPKVEMALYWYDRVIAEFPDTNAAELAYRGKLLALLGWEQAGQYGSSYGVEDNFTNYMPQVIATLNLFESAFPDSAYMQGLRYQIAQSYWAEESWEKTREWFRKVIDAGGDSSTFYTETAKQRLLKIEY